MNKRQRKKRDAKGLTLIFRCNGVFRAEDYEKMRQAKVRGHYIELTSDGKIKE